MQNTVKNKQNINSVPKFIKGIMLLFLFFPLITINNTMNTDCVFLINMGRYITENGFFTKDPFTLHTGMDSLAQQWLSDVIYYNVYRLLGIAGCVALVYIVFCVFQILLFKLSTLVSNNFFISCVICSVTGLYMCRAFFVSRPQIFTYLLIVFEFYVLEKYVKTKKARHLAWLLPISLLQINLHSSMWLMLFVLMLPVIADSIPFKFKTINKEPACKLLPLLAAALGMFGCGFINPYGIKAMTYLFTSYGYDVISENIYEMLSPSLHDLDGKAFFFMIATVICCFIFYRKGKTTLRHALLTAGTLYLGLSSMRSMSIFLIASALTLSFYFKEITVYLPSPEEKISKKSLAKLGGVLGVLLLCAFVIMLLPSPSANSTDQKISVSENEDVGRATQTASSAYKSLNNIIRILEEDGGPENVTIFNRIDAGSYLEFNGYKAYIDPRVELFLKDNNGQYNYINEYFNASYGKIYYRDFIEKYGFTHLIVSDSEPAIVSGLEQDSDFEKVYEDENYKLFRRAQKEVVK